MSEIYFITGNNIPEDQSSKFTSGFDAWVSFEGQQMVEQAATNNSLNDEWYYIYNEWAGRDAMAYSEISTKAEDDAGLFDIDDVDYIVEIDDIDLG